MKNIRKYGFMLLLGLAACMAGACSADKTDEKFTPKDPELTLGDGKPVSLGKTGGSATVAVKSNLPWRVTTSTDWIVIGDTESGLSDGEFSFSVDKNKTIKPRTGTITAYITDDCKKTLIVTQEASSYEDLIIHYYVKTDGRVDADGLSWENATTMASALDKCITGNFIHIAAGTYVPSVGLTGSAAAGDQTFEISANITLTGGYPADVTDENTQPDPKANPTIFSGLLPSGQNASHVMCVTAAKDPDWKVSVSGIQLRDGSFSAGTSLKVNGVTVPRSYGSALVVVNANAAFTNCVIGPNTGNGNIPGAWITAEANVNMDHCVISGNQTTSGNGAGIWNDWANVVLNHCTLTNNTCVGVGAAIYAHDSDNKGRVGTTYVYNSTFANNATDASRDSRRGGAFYGRENSVTRLVNCTITGNVGGNGGAIAAYGTAANNKTKIDIINCTITKNESKFSGTVEKNGYSEMHIYNSIISGNKAATLGSDNVIVVRDNSATMVPGELPTTMTYSVNGSTIYGSNKTVVAGAFDPETMFGPLADNDGPTQTILLMGTDNPARTLGMSTILLSSLGKNYAPAIGDEIILKDQTGATRSGSVMGACVK